MEKTFFSTGREFCLVSTAAVHLEARGQDDIADLGNFVERVPNVPTNHRLAWLPDGQEIRSTTCQMTDSAPRTAEITKTGCILIQTLWGEGKIMGSVKGTVPRSLPQNQRFIMPIAFWVEGGGHNCGEKAHTSRRSQFSHAMAVLERSGIPSKFSNIIRGLMEHARYCVRSSEGHIQYKVSSPCLDENQFMKEELESVGELSKVCSQIVLKCLY